MVLKSFLNKLHEFMVRPTEENLLTETENCKCSQFIKKMIWHQHRLFHFSSPHIEELDTRLKIFAFNKVTAAPQEALCKGQCLLYFILYCLLNKML